MQVESVVSTGPRLGTASKSGILRLGGEGGTRSYRFVRKCANSFSPIAGDRVQAQAGIGLREYIHVSVKAESGYILITELAEVATSLSASGGRSGAVRRQIIVILEFRAGESGPEHVKNTGRCAILVG